VFKQLIITSISQGSVLGVLPRVEALSTLSTAALGAIFGPFKPLEALFGRRETSDEQRRNARKQPRPVGLGPDIGARGVAALGNRTDILRQPGALLSPTSGFDTVADSY